jgi:hypothetical protein
MCPSVHANNVKAFDLDVRQDTRMIVVPSMDGLIQVNTYLHPDHR